MLESFRDGLLVKDLIAGWGPMQVLSGVSFCIPPTHCLAVLGRNGVGKSTLLSTIVGRAICSSGRLEYCGESIGSLPTHKRAARGIAFVPQEREIFPSLTLEENLTIAARRQTNASHWTLDRVYELFPRLKDRRTNKGNQLSGGEQQMLSIGRALMGNPTLLLMDEPMEGLAPTIVEQLLAAIHKIRAESAMSILVVEQHVDIALELTSRVMVLDRGVAVLDNSDGKLPPDRRRIEHLIGVGN